MRCSKKCFSDTIGVGAGGARGAEHPQPGCTGGGVEHLQPAEIFLLFILAFQKNYLLLQFSKIKWPKPEEKHDFGGS